MRSGAERVAELRPNARALLVEARQSVSPSAGELAELRARLPIEPPPSDPTPSDSTPGGGTSAANTALYVVAALVAIAIAAAAWMGSGERETPQHLGRLGPWLPAESLAPVAAIEAPPIVEKVVATPVAPRLEEPKVRSRSPRASKSESKSKSATPARSDLAAELALITTARKALRSSKYGEARTAAGTYLARFAAGSFVEEAKVLDLVAECGLERSPAALRRAEAYLASGQGAFAKRVRGACLEPR